MPTPEQEVGHDELQTALQQLVQAAGAEDAVDALKKGGVAHSGFTDERGKVGGGITSDTGRVESLMIGKMVEAGFDGAAAKAMVGFMGEHGILDKMSGKAKGKDDDDEGGDEDEMSAYARGYFEGLGKKGETKKSQDADEDEGDEGGEPGEPFAKSFGDDPEISPAVDASPWLEALTARTTEALDTLHKSITHARNEQTGINKASALAVYQMGTLLKSRDHVISALGERLGLLESQPMPPRGAASEPAAKAAQVLAKSFEGGGGAQGEALNKAELASTLSYLRFEKGMETIQGTKTGELAVYAESGGDVREDVLDFANKYLATHPNEREAALNYH